MIDAQALWQRCLELIHSRLNESQFATWFQPIGFKSYNEETKEVTIWRTWPRSWWRTV